jgi:hypothetical protein
MKTDALIDLLARGAGPAPRHGEWRRVLPAAVVGLGAAALLTLVIIGPVPGAMWGTPAPWIKLGYGLALGTLGLVLVVRLARPVAGVTTPRRGAVALVATMLALGALVWVLAPAADRTELLLGHSWQGCPINVALLALPGLLAGLWALRLLAPTRLRAAGAAVGVMAGALGAAAYGLSCTETSITFVAVWYTLGVALVTALGAWLGPRILRW